MKKFLVKTARGYTSFVDYLCRIKSAAEQDAIRRASAIADDIYTAVSKEIKPGTTENVIKDLFLESVKRSEADKEAFEVIVASGPNGAFPHAVPSDRIIGADDTVVIDFGVVYRGYHSDMTRTLLMNPGDSRAVSLYRLVYEAQKRALGQVKAGTEIRQLDTLVRDFFAEHDMKEYFVHGLGHGVGLRIHEQPFINQRARGALKPGMVITIEPGLYLPGYGGVRIEDTVIVTRNGYEILTRSPKIEY